MRAFRVDRFRSNETPESQYGSPSTMYFTRAYLTLELTLVPKALTRPTPRCLYIADFLDGLRPIDSSARSRSRLRERPTGRERERARGGRPSSTARRPARSERPAGYARSCPARTAGQCPGRLSPRTRAAVWRATAQAAQSAGTRKPARGATDGDTRRRRGHIHFSPERALAVPRAPACPEWSVASDAEGGSGERGGPLRTHLSSWPRHSAIQLPSWWTQKGRGRFGRPPTPQAPQARGAQWWSRDAERPRAFRNCISIVVLRVRFCKELAGCCPDTNTVDVAHLEVVRGGPKGVVVDEDAMDNGSDGLSPLPIDDSSHHLVEMRVPVLRSRMVRAFEDEFDHVIN